MDHTQTINFEELFSQLTTEEKLQAFTLLAETDVTYVDEQLLAPGIQQLRQLKALQRQYTYQRKVLEHELITCAPTELADLIVRASRAAGAVEVISYIINLAPIQPLQPTQQESDPS